jgi:hypothetical protein
VKAKDVPQPVLAAATKAAPNAKVKEWEKNVEDGKTTYEVSMTEGSAKFQLVFEPNGTYVAKEETIPVSSLPAAVKSAVLAKYPKATLSSAEKITHPTATEYEVVLKNAAKKEILLSSDGKILKEE